MELAQYSSPSSLRKHSAILGCAARTAGAQCEKEGRIGYTKKERKNICVFSNQI